MKSAKCWSCGKPQRDVDGATCRGCGHVVCLKCAKRYGHIDAGEHGKKPRAKKAKH